MEMYDVTLLELPTRSTTQPTTSAAFVSVRKICVGDTEATPCAALLTEKVTYTAVLFQPVAFGEGGKCWKR
jgi:hypothetical protein